MDTEAQLRLQAYLDGELAEAEARSVANWLAQDREAVALLSELRQTRKALANFESGIQLPESREFYWARIEREILREPASEPSRQRRSLFEIWRRLAPLAGTVVLLMLVGLTTGWWLGLFSRSELPEFKAALADPGAFTYRDQSAGATLIWLSYPAENEFAEDEDAVIIE